MPKGRNLMRIGELSEKSRLSTRTIHYYEEIGLISPSCRTVGGFRLYSEGQLEKLKLIRELKVSNIPLCKIKELIIGSDQRAGDPKFKACVESQIRKTKSKIFQYISLKDDLQETIEILNECESRRCDKKPTETNCRCCEVVLDRDFIPITFKAVYIT